MSTLNKIGHNLEKLISYVVFILMSTLVLLVFAQVLLRYVFSTGLVWAEELDRYIFVWLMFLGITMGIYKQRHIAITVITDRFKKYKKGIRLMTHIITASFFCLLMWQGLIFVTESSAGMASVLPISLGVIYSIIPVASLLAVIFILLLIAGHKEDI